MSKRLVAGQIFALRGAFAVAIVGVMAAPVVASSAVTASSASISVAAAGVNDSGQVAETIPVPARAGRTTARQTRSMGRRQTMLSGS